MKKLFTFLTIAVFSIAITYAQPTLTSATHMPGIGDSYTLAKADDITDVMVDYYTGSTGADHEWNLSGFSSSNAVTFMGVDPSTTADGASFPTANVAVTVNGSDAKYFISDATSFSFIGNNQDFDALGKAIINYSDAAKYKEFPFTYNDTFTDNFASTFILMFSATRSGSLTVTADGYGTVLLPGNITYTNTLRIKKVETISDVAALGTSDAVITTCEWFLPGDKYPVLVIGDTNITMVVNGEITVINNYGILYDDVSNSINTVEKSNINIFPNPVNKGQAVNIQLDDVSTLEVYDELGNMIVTKASVKNYNFTTSKLNAGVYFIRAISNKKTTVKKLIIQ